MNKLSNCNYKNNPTVCFLQLNLLFKHIMHESFSEEKQLHRRHFLQLEATFVVNQAKQKYKKERIQFTQYRYGEGVMLQISDSHVGDYKVLLSSGI
jgi:hypothetical protein